jgi:hypothetical protein
MFAFATNVTSLQLEGEFRQLKTRVAAPRVLIITYAAKRAVAFVKALSTFGGSKSRGRMHKLFAKHMSIADQKSALAASTVHSMAVGTPQRLTSLCEVKALNLADVRLLIIDAGADAKGMNMFTSKDVRRAFFHVFNTHVLPAAAAQATAAAAKQKKAVGDAGDEDDRMRICLF